jgi:hypothetical protein
MDGKRMAKKKRNGGKRSKKLPILAVGGTALTGYQLYQNWAATKGSSNRADSFVWRTTGYSLAAGTGFSWGKTLQTFGPAVMGIAGSLIAAKANVNRYISFIPFVKW